MGMDGLQFLSFSTGAPANLDLSLSIGFPLENPLYKERCSSKCLKITVSEQASSKARRLSNQHQVAAMQAARLGRDRGAERGKKAAGRGDSAGPGQTAVGGPAKGAGGMGPAANGFFTLRVGGDMDEGSGAQSQKEVREA